MTRSLCKRTVSDFGMGTWGVGGKSAPDPKEDDLHVESLRYAIDKGINVIDTAEMYASGHTEELVGKAISIYDREDLFIITKVWNTHLMRDDLIKAAKHSLERLHTSYADLYLIHWPNQSVPIGETISAMEQLVRDGLVRSIGVSNFGVTEMQEAMDAAKTCDIAANQIEYSYGKRSPENDIIPFCEKSGVEVIAYTPIMKGNVNSYDSLRRIAAKHDATPVQVALRYVMRKSYPIPKSSSKGNIDELLGANAFDLTDAEYMQLHDKQ